VQSARSCTAYSEDSLCFGGRVCRVADFHQNGIHYAEYLFSRSSTGLELFRLDKDGMLDLRLLGGVHKKYGVLGCNIA
jgi:hypothetical protein